MSDFTPQIIVLNLLGKICNGYSPVLDCHIADVSQYSDKYYKDETETCCTTSYMPNCVRKQKKFCVEVNETKCKAFAHPKCTTSIEFKDGGSRAELTPTTADLKNCVAKEVVVNHVKKVPHCEDKTSLNCETGWKVVNGEKVKLFFN